MTIRPCVLLCYYLYSKLDAIQNIKRISKNAVKPESRPKLVARHAKEHIIKKEVALVYILSVTYISFYPLIASKAYRCRLCFPMVVQKAN